MRTLYLDCGMGAAGDMLTAALLELFPNPEEMVQKLNSLQIPGVRYARETTQKCGITGTHMHVWIDGTEESEHVHSHADGHTHTHSRDHHHGSMDEIMHWISHMDASSSVKNSIQEVYNRIAEAESSVHGVPVTQIHFHEVGSLDALADVAAVCYLMEALGNPRVVASPVHVGSGHVFCAHGILPVPAPATAAILKGVPVYGGQIQGELCTPTGAALLKQFVSEFGNMPTMVPEAIGYGMGKKDFPMANCVRAILGNTGSNQEDILELSCNLDDMTAEEIGFAMDAILKAGAPDVYTSAIGMKKNRPGTMLTVLCRPEQKDEMVRLIFAHTSTLGIRESSHKRYTLTRHMETIDTEYGTIRRKIAEGYGVNRCKYEYDDLAAAAQEAKLSIAQIRSAIEKAEN